MGSHYQRKFVKHSKYIGSSSICMRELKLVKHSENVNHDVNRHVNQVFDLQCDPHGIIKDVWWPRVWQTFFDSVKRDFQALERASLWKLSMKTLETTGLMRALKAEVSSHVTSECQHVDISACNSANKPSFQNLTKCYFAQCSIDGKGSVTF